jgi:hypothetical protein
MNRSFAALERQRLARCRLLSELRYRRLPHPSGWSHCGTQSGTEPTSLALLTLHSSSSASTVSRQELETLLACQRPNGLWPAVANGTAGVSLWASAMAANTLMILGAAPETFVGALDSLVNNRPLEASWLVRLKFRLSDRQVRFDPAKYGWAWVPDTVSWVVPTSMALITLERSRKQGLFRGKGLQTRLRLGAEMLIDRACPEGGWNAANAMVYGVPLRPHVDATAIALAALRFHHDLPIVRDSLTWMLNRIDCQSAYSPAWVILSAAAYKDLRSDVSAALDTARDRLAALVDDPKEVQDTATVALAALALEPETATNPFEVKMCGLMNRRIFGSSLLAGTAVLAVRRLCSTGCLRDRRRRRSRVAILHADCYDGPLGRTLIEGLRVFDLGVRGKTVLLKPNLVEYIPGTEVNTDPRLVGAAAGAFLALGAKSVQVGEGPGHQRDTFLVLAESGLEKELQSRRIRFVDLNRDEIRHVPLPTSFAGLNDTPSAPNAQAHA